MNKLTKFFGLLCAGGAPAAVAQHTGLIQDAPECWEQPASMAKSFYAVSRDSNKAYTGTSSARLLSLADDIQSARLVQVTDAKELAGKRIEFSAFLRYEESDPEVFMGMTAVDADGNILSGTRTQWKSETQSWHARSVAMDVPSDAAALTFGFSLSRQGVLWVDDVQLAVTGAADTDQHSLQPAALERIEAQACNLDFESWISGEPASQATAELSDEP